jgi:hypothetical protein
MVMEVVTGVTITVNKNGVAIAMAMGIGMVGIDLDINNPIPTLNLSMSHRQYIIRHSNRPASVCFFLLIFITGRYYLKPAHANAVGWLNQGSSSFAINELRSSLPRLS